MSLELRPFKSLIRQRCGLACEGNCEERLSRALDERIASLPLNPADYYARLRDDESEFQELVNLLTINETYFFREPEQIALLAEKLVPRFLAARRDSAPIRILSAGCSSGEEPYSLAMALMDKYGKNVEQLFSFAGGDIDSAILNKARAGRYTDFSFRGVPDEIRSRYFDRTPHGHVLKEHVRQLVGFHELNLLADSFPAALRDFDIILLRNVSIYFDTPTRKLIQQNLASLLKDDGLLIIGTAETLANDLGVLSLTEEDGLYYFVKGNPPLPAAAMLPATALPPPRQPLPELRAFEPKPALPIQEPPGPWSLPVGKPVEAAVLHRPPAQTALAQARQLVCDRLYDAALPELDAVLAADPDNTEAQLLKAHVLINRNAFAAAGMLAQRVLTAHPWSIDALLLLGLAAKWQQNHAVAIKHFKHAIYSRHECWPAHYYLADLYRNGGETELARRAYRVVIQLLSGDEPDTGIKHVPFGLPTREIRFLCEHQLGKLPGAKMLAEQR